MSATEIENGTYTRDQLSRMDGRRAWNAHIPAAEGETRDAARAGLIGDAIEQIHEYEVSTGLTGAAEIVNGKIVAIVEA